MRALYSLAEHWIARHAAPDADALAAAAGLTPAVVITGGSAGIGAALAARFARAGTHRVVLVARDATRLADAQDAIARACGTPQPLVIALDVTRADAFEVLSRHLSEERLFLDVLVNSAGLGHAGAFAAQDLDGLSQLLDVNVQAVARLMRGALPGMLARGRGGILNVASLGGLVPGPQQAAYYASKAFVVSLTEAVRHEVNGRGVRVCVLAPGPVQTSFHARMGVRSALYRVVLPQRPAEMIARVGYRGFMLGRGVVVPGAFEAIGAVVLRLLPHRISVSVMSALLLERDKPGRTHSGKT